MTQMNHKLSERQQQLVVRIAQSTDESAKQALRAWIEELLQIRQSNDGWWQKFRQAVSANARSEVILPIVKAMALELKRIGWDQRTAVGRSIIFGSGFGLLLLGGKSAGLAAFGTAIGVPLWVVFGAGAVFVTALYKEISEGRPPRTDYRVIEADREDRPPP